MSQSIKHRGWKWSVADASNPTLVAVLDDTSKSVHITDGSDQNTDWNVAADSHPSVYVHSATTPATDYLKLYHDATNGYIDSVGGNLVLAIAGTNELTLTATALSPTTSDGNALGTTALMWADLFLASGGVINFDNGDVTLTHSANTLAIAGGDVTIASGTGLNVGSVTQLTVSDGDGSTNLIPEVQFLGVGASMPGGALVLGTFNTTNDRTVSPKLILVKGAAATQVATTAVADNEVVGSIIAYASDSADFETPVGAIEFVVDDAGGPGASAIGGSIEFYTTADGGTTLTKALTLDTNQNLLIGLNGGAVTFTQGAPKLAVYLTNASTHASNSVNSLYWETTMTGAAGVGGRALFYMTTNVALGGWSNALKAQVLYGASGSTSGLGSAFCAELTLSAGTSAGTYAALEAELNAPANAVTGTATSFLYMNATDTATVINGPNGYLFELGSGITDTSGGIFEAEVNTDSMSMTHVLKIRIAGTAYYIPLNTAKTF